MKFTDKKLNVEKKITNLVKEFVDETGVNINYINVTDDKSAGFTSSDTAIKTKIILKND